MSNNLQKKMHNQTISEASYHYRLHKKSDGRDLHLYSLQPHTESPIDVPAEIPVERNSHRRWHPLRQEWVVYSSHRQDRTFMPPAEFCPLCPAGKTEVAGEIPFKNFEIAVFDNKFPAFFPNATVADHLHFQTAAATGKCEVIVFSDEHVGSQSTLTQQRRELLIHAWNDRYKKLLAEPFIQFVMPFENRGVEAGVTLHHPHGQIYAYPYIPPFQKLAADAFRQSAVILDLLKNTGKNYIVEEDDNFAVFVPPFARFPYEMWLAPKTRHAGSWTFNAAEISSFAKFLGRTVQRYDRFFNRTTPYVFTLQAAPKGEESHFHFWAQFYPLLRNETRLKFMAGCELGSGSFLADILPEDAAQKLRDVNIN